MGNNNGSGNSGDIQRLFEKAARDYYKELGDYYWLIAGVIAGIVCVLGGVYLSQYAISNVIGAVGFMLIAGWAIAIIISSLEVAGVKLLGNKSRSDEIKSSNKLEHTIALVLTVILFAFDVFTNGLGAYIFTVAHVGKVEGWSWLIIVLIAVLFGVSELIVGWLLRSVATAYITFRYAKQKYDCFKEKFDKITASTVEKSFGQQQQVNSARPRQDFDRFPEDYPQGEFRRNLQPSLAARGGGDGHYGPRG
jgi:hypothetical protein